MCGFAGFVGGDLPLERGTETLRRMIAPIRHRGPDDDGVLYDPSAGVGLGHRRLSILDLSAHGHQPMRSASARYLVAYNGEIYNFEALRKELEGGYPFHGHSDTEVMLAAFERWGVEAAVRRFDGMFAFAVWDRRERRLWLGRDRMGEKPLYYGAPPGVLLFGSELKALRAHPAFRDELDRGALALYLRHKYVPGPYSIYRGIRKLPPGTLLSVPTEAPERAGDPIPYWSLRDAAERGRREPFRGSDGQAVDALEEALRSSIRRRMVADVPVGAFLSGGIDSSTVVALMQASSPRPVRTFTIGFREALYNEAEHAARVARHLGTDHTELYISPAEARAVIPELPRIYDEPFADSSQIPTFLVARLAREDVTVVLSGDGGDELFGGYNRYFWARSIWGKVGWLPATARRLLSRALFAVPAARVDATMESLVRRIGDRLPRKLPQTRPGEKLHKVAEVLGVSAPEEMYRLLVSDWKAPEEVVLGGKEPLTPLTASGDWPDLPELAHRMMYLDGVTYLPDDILVKLDRATMAVSLEGRVPLLDHQVVELAWRMPLGLKIRDGEGKWLLRQVLHRHVPPDLVERPKMGFGVPIDHWLRDELRDWAESLLDERRLREDGFFAPGPIRRRWDEHLTGARNWEYYLWDILMFQEWLDAQRARPATAPARPASLAI